MGGKNKNKKWFIEKVTQGSKKKCESFQLLYKLRHLHIRFHLPFEVHLRTRTEQANAQLHFSLLGAQEPSHLRAAQLQQNRTPQVIESEKLCVSSHFCPCLGGHAQVYNVVLKCMWLSVCGFFFILAPSPQTKIVVDNCFYSVKTFVSCWHLISRYILWVKLEGKSKSEF